MRTPTEHPNEDGTTTYRVRFRLGSSQTSQTFRRKSDAQTFAAILAGENGVTDALGWLAAKQQAAEVATFADFFEHYVDQLTGVTPRTRSDYQAMHRRYLSHLDPTPITLVTRSHVTGMVNGLDAEGKSRKTIKNVLHMLSSCMALAIDEQLIARNPCRRVRLPAQRHDAKEVQFLTYDEAGRLLDALPDHWKPLVTFLLGTGLRWSEATALTWRNVDLDNGTVRVTQAWKRVPGKGMEIGPPKSAKSRRTVNAAVPALLAIEPLQAGPNDYVFTALRGGPVRHSNFYNRVWVEAVKAAGLSPAPNIHACRHTHASWLISDGQSLEAVQDQLGHESILTTRGTYGHLLPAVGVAVGRSASESMRLVLADRPQALTASHVLALEAAGGPDQVTKP